MTGQRDKSTHTHKKVLKGNSDRTLVPVIVLAAMMLIVYPVKHVSRGGILRSSTASVKITKEKREPDEEKTLVFGGWRWVYTISGGLVQGPEVCPILGVFREATRDRTDGGCTF